MLLLPSISSAINNNDTSVSTMVSYNEKNPEIKYIGNSNKDKNKFLTKEDAIKKVKIKKDGKLLKAELVKWEKHVKDVLEKENISEIANDRMIWEVVVDYPEGVDTRGGYFNTAQQIFAFDAETGELFGVSTRGDSPN